MTFYVIFHKFISLYIEIKRIIFKHKDQSILLDLGYLVSWGMKEPIETFSLISYISL
jgi:hypothetical protein